MEKQLIHWDLVDVSFWTRGRRWEVGNRRIIGKQDNFQGCKFIESRRQRVDSNCPLG
ncbi:MAG: hypothetical protein GX231_02900 [Tissierellia bacterium]|nr:hypothetical protein [Tissierellia bacterium]